MKRVTPFALVGTILTAAPAFARTWCIQPDGLGDAPTVQAGVDSSAVGDTVALSCGTYYEHDITIHTPIVLTSVTGQADCATIAATSNGRVISCCDFPPLPGDLMIVGLTLTGGDATGYGGAATAIGGAIWYERSLPSATFTVRSCVLRNNRATSGGGFAIAGSAATTIVEDCVFLGNHATENGGGLYFWTDTGDPMLLRRSTFIDNVAALAGGGAHTELGVGLIVSECLFSQNRAEGRWGGGLSIADAGVVEHCTIAQNYAPQGGGLAVYMHGYPFLAVENVILWSNAGAAGHELFFRSSLARSLTIRCSDIEQTPAWYAADGPVILDMDASNLWADPTFCDANAGDYSISSSSPCAPAHSSGCGLVGALPVECGPVALDRTTWGMIKADYRSPRTTR